jgi:predicted dehydrogenase
MFAQAITMDLSKEGIVQALKTGPYGRCVFRCDNDVVDHQTTLIEMEDGTDVSLTMHGFSHDGGRSVRLQGTKGTLIAEALDREFVVYDHLTGRRDVLRPGKTTGGHGGGDDGVLSSFVQTIQQDISGHTDRLEVRTSARVSLEGHLMAFAAEESRLTGLPIDMTEYRQAVEARAAEMEISGVMA